MKNEKGITLVELLATIVITFFAMGIIYSVVMLAINYFNAETTKTRLQQEANYIITELQSEHRENRGDSEDQEDQDEDNCYVLLIDENQVAIKDDCKQDADTTVISSSFTYEATIKHRGEKVKSPFEKEIYPLEDDVILNPFNIKDVENKELEVTVSTAISRYKD